MSEDQIAEESYRTALYDMFTAMLKFLSADDLKWLMPRLKNYVEYEIEKRNKK